MSLWRVVLRRDITEEAVISVEAANETQAMRRARFLADGWRCAYTPRIYPVSICEETDPAN